MKAQVFLAGASLVLLAACGRDPGAAGALSPEAAAGYLAAPVVSGAAVSPAGATLAGQTAPRAQVRLATPTGQAWSVTADVDGAWRLNLPALDAPQIFGLSMTAGGRRVQAEGYVLVAPQAAALLRPGAGAMRLDPGSAGVTAVDFDRQGSGVMSGRGQADTSVTVRVDGRYAGDGRIDPQGRFSLALPQLTPGAHQLQVTGEGFASQVVLDATPPAPLVDGPLRSQFTAAGLRADWLTPGGGVQSTLLPGPTEK